MQEQWLNSDYQPTPTQSNKKEIQKKLTSNIARLIYNSVGSAATMKTSTVLPWRQLLLTQRVARYSPGNPAVTRMRERWGGKGGEF